MDIEDIILGLEFMKKHQVNLDIAHLKMSIGKQRDQLSATEQNTKPQDPFVEAITNKVIDTGPLGDTTRVIMTERRQRQRNFDALLIEEKSQTSSFAIELDKHRGSNLPPGLPIPNSENGNNKVYILMTMVTLIGIYGHLRVLPRRMQLKVLTKNALKQEVGHRCVPGLASNSPLHLG